MNVPLRVGVVARSVFPLHGYGGLERHVYDLVRHLAREGVLVTLITQPARQGVANSDNAPAGASAIFDPREADSGGRTAGASVHIMTVPYRTFPFAGRRGTTILDRSTAYPIFGERAGRLAWTLVRDQRLDVVHGLGASVLGYARRRARCTAPLVLNPQGLEEFGATDPSRARAKRAAYLPLRRAVLACARAADCVIATDRALEPAVLRHLHVSREKVRLIPNAIDIASIDRSTEPGAATRVRRTAGLGETDVVLLSVGRLEANKGFGVLVDALAALHTHGDPLAGRWRWVLIGDGPNRRTLELAIGDAGLREHVLLAGRLPDADLHAWYEAATLFVHPTLYEGSSLVTLEAMAHRRAVVASNAGGLPDKVRTGLNGWLVEPGRPDALAAAISGALGQPRDRLHAMGDASRHIVEQEFAWPVVTRTLLELYAELLA
ncbi:MAG TPA: glycosyltransferase family 4 protein [Vicinamibacterales bacterium]|nr:glycosyltransferase family 4 protein [Vicinamibacterales bacterium]